jgi:hypothetical protein
MASINTGKVIVGGLVAGVVANAIDFVTNTYVLAPDWAAFAQGHNLDPNAMNSPAVAATWITVDFLFGWLMVWTYAAVRPRLGPGVSTALIVGLVIYLAPTLVLFGFTQMGLMTMTMFVKGSCGAIVATLAAAVAGAAVYTEAPAGAYAEV